MSFDIEIGPKKRVKVDCEENQWYALIWFI